MIRHLLPLLFAVRLSSAAGVTEEPVEHAGAKFRVVRLEPQQVQLVWKNDKGEPYRSFDRVQADFSAKVKKVTFLMNAGIFEPGGTPTGLHFEGGKESRPLNQAEGKGNFFLKPNGVCFVSRNRVSIVPAAAWRVSDGISWAIQAGPMLLIDGKRHPAFKEGSDNRLLRNGAGVDDQGRLVFAITSKGQMVNFWDFAGLFLKLGCRNALFLDGDISQMAVNPEKKIESNLFAAMFVVAE